jgi:predicted small lipoprotein YifL
LSILVALALAACGQRGPLYLPDEEQAVQPAGQADEDELEDDDAPPQQG